MDDEEFLSNLAARAELADRYEKALENIVRLADRIDRKPGDYIKIAKEALEGKKESKDYKLGDHTPSVDRHGDIQ